MSQLTVRELLCDAGLGLTVVTGDVSLERTIRGIHLSDLLDPTPWMTPGMVLVTTGHLLAESPAASADYVARLATAECAALGIGVGHYLDAVPNILLARACDVRLPVFVSPFELPFRTIVAYVYNAHSSDDLYQLRRGTAVQMRLLDLLIDEKGETELVDVLSQVLRMHTVLYDARGAVLAEAGAERSTSWSSSELWGEYEQGIETVNPLGVIEAVDRRIYFRTILVRGIVDRILIASGTRALAREFIEPALTYAQRLLVLERLRQGEELRERRRRWHELLRDLFAGVTPAGELDERMSREGLRLARRWRIIVCDSPRAARQPSLSANGDALGSAPAGATAAALRLQDALDTALGDTGIPFLTTTRGSGVVALVEVNRSDDDLRSLLLSLRAAIAGRLPEEAPALACSAAASGRAAAAQSLGEALEALRTAAGMPGGSGVAVFSKDDIFGLVLRPRSDDTVRLLDERFIAPLRDHDATHRSELVKTLRCLFDCRLSAKPTAERLFIHLNTLKKRLRRIEALLGIDLDSPRDIAMLYVVLEATAAEDRGEEA